MKKQHNSDQWISISDMMTGLMIIFMFIALNYILQFMEYKFIEKEIYNSLELEFREEIKKGIIKLGPDGSVSFNQKRDAQIFPSGEIALTDDFKKILNQFLPRYINILSNPEYIDNIKEIRIEGHTDTIPLGPSIKHKGYDNYENNLFLSSGRAINVLKYIRSSDAYLSLDDATKKKLEFLFTANGLSYSKTLNKQGEYAYINGGEISNCASRRVEFRVITSNDKMVKQILGK